MSATIKNNLKFAGASLVIVICGFWYNMQDYQKDRVATAIVRSVENVVTQSDEPLQLETREPQRPHDPSADKS